MRFFAVTVLLSALCAWSPAPCRAGETRAEAGLGLAGEYSDNVTESSHGAKADFITHVKPRLLFEHEGGRILAKADYRGDYQYYMRGNASDDYAHYLRASALGEVVENLFFVDLSEDFRPVYGNSARGEVVEGDSTQDLVNRNTFQASPYFSLHFSDRTQGRFGYRFTDTRYSDDWDSHKRPLPGLNNSFSTKSSQQHSAFANLDHAVSERGGLQTGAEITRLDAKRQDDLPSESTTRYMAYVGGSYLLADGLSVSARVGPNLSVPDEGSRSLRPYVSSELKYALGRSEFGLGYTMDYTSDPRTGGDTQRTQYRGWWTKNFDRTWLGANVIYTSNESLHEGTQEYFRPSISLRRELSERLSAFATLTGDFNTSGGDDADRYYAQVGLRHELSEDSWLSLSYTGKLVGKAGGPSRDGATRSDQVDGYEVNRIMVEIYMAF